MKGFFFLRAFFGLALLWLGSGCAISLLDGPKADPALRWQVIETPHFRVYFHQGEDALGQKAARIAEEVHDLLSPRLGWDPKEPTHLVIVDSVDTANGGATPFPNNTIYIFPTPPAASVVPFIYRLDDWLRDVITHEYTHILQLDMNKGFPAAMRAIFGKQPLPFIIFNGGLPNLLQPDWLIEGLATYEETATGASDRRDSAYSDMLLRMAILEDRFPTLDQAGGRDTWPGNQIQYLFGAKFYDYLARRFGEDTLKQISLEYSDNVIPFFVGTTGYQIFGQTYDSLWESWKSDLKEQYLTQRKELEGLGLTSGSPITHRGDYNLGPKTNPSDSTLAYTSLNPHEYPSLRLYDMETGRDNRLIRRNVGYTVSWSPNGEIIAFSQMEVFKNYSEFNDLYLYHLSNRKLTRLTKGARLREPDFHPDGTRLISVENRLGRNRLVVYHLKTGGLEPLDWTDGPAILTHPRWSPDGKRIAVNFWKNGSQGIYLVDPVQKHIQPLLADRALDLAPAWSPDGNYLVFSSDRTGIFNLYAFRIETDGLFQITNLIGGAFTPEVTPDGQDIIYASYNSTGFDLYRMGWNPEEWKKIETPPVPTEEVAAPNSPELPIEAKPYSPLPTFRPRFWTPIFGADESGLQIGAATGGMDVLGKHKFDAVALHGTRSGRTAYSIQYRNDAFYPSFNLGYSDFGVLHSDLFRAPDFSEDYWEHRRRLDAEITIPRIFLQTQQSFTLGYRSEWFSGLSDIPAGFASPEEGLLRGLRLHWMLNTSKEYGFSISREEGRRISASYTHFASWIGSGLDQKRYVASWHEYLSLFSRHHVLAARLAGAAATGDRTVQGAFQVGGPTLTEEFLDPEQAEFFLRGYPAREMRGRKAALGSLEYRFPLANVEQGISTWPFFMKRNHGAIFYDIGNAWDRPTKLSEFRRGVGAEFIMDMVLGHQLPVRLRLGTAWGLDKEGERQTYITVGNSF